MFVKGFVKEIFRLAHIAGSNPTIIAGRTKFQDFILKHRAFSNAKLIAVGRVEGKKWKKNRFKNQRVVRVKIEDAGRISSAPGPLLPPKRTSPA